MSLLTRLGSAWVKLPIYRGWIKVPPSFPITAMSGIGVTAVLWANIEILLDLLISWHASTRNVDMKHGHPRSFSKKTDYLKYHMERDDRLDRTDREQIRAMRLEANRISEVRNDFIHSFASIAVTQNAWEELARLQYGATGISVVHKEYRQTDLNRAIQDIGQLTGELAPFVQRLAEPWLIANASRFTNSSAGNPRP